MIGSWLQFWRTFSGFLNRCGGSIGVLVGILFGIYFISACGTYNSGDAPQYFTTRALIEKNSVDIARYAGLPNYYVYPDIFFGKNGEIFGVRGYLTSAASIPLYWLGREMAGYVNTNKFPAQEQSVEDFETELNYTALFGLFTALGIGYLVAALKKAGGGRWSSWGLGLLAGIGTYAWKYANYVSRHGLEILIIGMVSYALVRRSERNSEFKEAWIAGLWGLAFGIDPVLFGGLSIFLGWRMIKNYSMKMMFQFSGILLLVIGGQVFLNKYWYSQMTAFGTLKQPTVLDLVGQKNTAKVWLSSPWGPAVGAALLNWGRLDEKCFENLDRWPAELAMFVSADFAKNYKFFGIFIISPFLYHSVGSFFIRKRFEARQKEVIDFCWMVFAVGVAANAKVLNFWGGNQYDVRYFYPFALGLIIPIGLTLTKIRTWGWIPVKISIWLTGLFSIYMGWLGQLGMFHPGATGERKIWILRPIKFLFDRPDDSLLFNLTFYNSDNWRIAVGLITAGAAVCWLIPRVKFMKNSGFRLKQDGLHDLKSIRTRSR